MKLYMLDTNICIYLIKKKPISYFETLAKLSRNNNFAISSIVLAELQYGVANSSRKEGSQIDLNLLTSKLEILPYTEECAFYYGEIRRDLKQQGLMIGSNDLLIASHALYKNAVLVTNNSSEFHRVKDLATENWNY